MWFLKQSHTNGVPSLDYLHDEVMHVDRAHVQDGLGVERRQRHEGEEDHEKGGRDGAQVVQALERAVHRGIAGCSVGPFRARRVYVES